MSKSSFINKKALTVIILIIAFIGIGVGSYFIFKPKADLKAPFKNAYNLYNNQTYSEVLNFNQKIVSLLKSKDFSELSEEDKQNVQITRFKYQIYSNLNWSYLSIKDLLLNNIYFIEDKNDSLYKLEKAVSSNYENIIKLLKDCKTYIDTYLQPDIIETYISNTLIWQKIDNYNAIYDELFRNISSFYFNLGKIFFNNCLNTISSNLFTKYNILTTVTWAQTTTNLIINNNEKSNFVEIYNATENLKNFVYKNIVNPINEYFTDFQSFNNIINCFNYIDYDNCIIALAKNIFLEFSQSLDKNLQKYIILLKTNYFFV